MVKYLHHLLTDIEHSIELASQLPARDWFPDDEENEEETNLAAVKLKKLSDIYDLPYEAFPPEKLLTDSQVILLTDSIHRLWSSWRLWWDLPKQLTDRQHYSALLHAMQHQEVPWSPIKGADVAICQFEKGDFCPFGENAGYCHCKVLDDSVRLDLAIWEEHVRSQGIDPYRELSEEEGSAFEENMRQKNLRKRFGDDWLIFGLHDAPIDFERQAKDHESDDEWTSYIWDEDDQVYDESQQGNPNDEDPNHPSDENGSDYPLF